MRTILSGKHTAEGESSRCVFFNTHLSQIHVLSFIAVQVPRIVLNHRAGVDYKDHSEQRVDTDKNFLGPGRRKACGGK